MLKLPKCKITVLKRTINKDLIEEYAEDSFKNINRCECFKDGQEIIYDPNSASVPDNFCHWAWADIRKDINMIALGGNEPGMKKEGITITGCTDWFRPVIFKIERME